MPGNLLINHSYLYLPSPSCLVKEEILIQFKLHTFIKFLNANNKDASSTSLHNISNEQNVLHTLPIRINRCNKNNVHIKI